MCCTCCPLVPAVVNLLMPFGAILLALVLMDQFLVAGEIKELINSQKITVPIVRIKEDVYLVGANQSTLKLEQGELFVRSGLTKQIGKFLKKNKVGINQCRRNEV